MRVYISTDIEGITGLAAWSQCGRPNSDHFDFRWARERYTADVNAAIRGLRKAGGADIEIVLKDSHGNSKNLLIDQLEPGIEVVTGYGAGSDGMMMGLDDTFDAAVLVGYHARAGSLRGVMDHTISGRLHRLWLNGIEIGEIGLSALVAGRFGVPIVAISSDAAGCAEASDLIPGIATASVKQGMGRYMTQTLHPSESLPLIETTMEHGLRQAANVKPLVWSEPMVLRAEWNRSEEADYCERAVGTRRIDGYSVEFGPAPFIECHQTAWTWVALAQAGYDANN